MGGCKCSLYFVLFVVVAVVAFWLGSGGGAVGVASVIFLLPDMAPPLRSSDTCSFLSFVFHVQLVTCGSIFVFFFWTKSFLHFSGYFLRYVFLAFSVLDSS